MNDALNIGQALPLAPTLGPLVREGGMTPRQALDRLASGGFRFVQLDATTAGLRPRELDKSARRDVLAVMRRLELSIAGIDIWIPAEHFHDPARLDRAVAAIQQAISLAADLERCPVSCALPAKTADNAQINDALSAIAGEADRQGVQVADHAVPPSSHERIGVGIDPIAWIVNGQDPTQTAIEHAPRLVAARLSQLDPSGQRAALDTGPGGRLDVLSYQLALAGAGYHRPVVLDARQWTDVWGGLSKSSAIWADLLRV